MSNGKFSIIDAMAARINAVIDVDNDSFVTIKVDDGCAEIWLKENKWVRRGLTCASKELVATVEKMAEAMGCEVSWNHLRSSFWIKE